MHSTTSNKIMTTTSQNKSPLLKTKTSPSVATISNATIVSKSDSLEIEEISKKISEHADALYRTWKNRGLVPPAEILEFYTVEAAQAAGASKEELQSTEGLQKLVNTFVIKDKEQRGKVKKTATTKTPTTTTTATCSNTEVKTSTTTTAVTIKNQLSDHVTATISLSSNPKMPSSSSSSSSSSLVSPISQNALTSTTSTLIFNNNSVTKSATNLNGNTKKFVMNTAPHVTTKVPVSSQATAHLEKNLNFDIDLDLKLDLNLDVKQLSEMQNQNLRKIKDLLNQSNAKIPTKIPTLTINTNNSNQGRGGAGVEHSIKMKTSAKVTNIITAPLIDDLRQRLKHDDGNDKNETTIREVLIAMRSNFLTRGSVAERVLMFEKCPDVRNAFLNIKRPDKVDTPPKVQIVTRWSPSSIILHSFKKSFAIDRSEDQYRQDYPTLCKAIEGQKTLFQSQWFWKA
uniref:Uncharacterized protein n=1 Tax=Glossina pallidipes TaxID=7398 RepID=A0A1A9Z3T5_GLOPL